MFSEHFFFIFHLLFVLVIMITILPCFGVFFTVLLSFKDSLFFCSYFNLDKFSIILILVFPFFLVFLNKFSLNSIISSSVFSLRLIIIFLFFFFCCQNQYLFIFFLELCSFFIIYRVFDLSKSWDKSSSLIFIFFINILGSVPFMFFCVSNYLLIVNFIYIGLNEFNFSFFFFFFFILVFLRKVPLFFFHFWLTKAHVRAFSVCSMLLARLIIKLGTIGLFKFNFFFLNTNICFSLLFISFCLFSCILLRTLMFRFFDIKILVACSSILHISMLVPLSMLIDSFSLASFFFINLGHGLVSCYLFFLVSLGYETNQRRNIIFNKRFNSFNFFFTLIYAFSIFFNVGLPPFVGFYREVLICFFLLNLRSFSLFIFLIFMFLSILFRIFMVLNVSFGKKNFILFFEVDSFFSWIFLFLMFIIILCPFLLSYSFIKSLF